MSTFLHRRFLKRNDKKRGMDGMGRGERYSLFVLLTTREVTRAIKRLKRGPRVGPGSGERILFRPLISRTQSRSRVTSESVRRPEKYETK